jgi:crotonobetainyl-CoA:carnitine CoA-transferase CaiB-like acyl-CoA transferase
MQDLFSDYKIVEIGGGVASSAAGKQFSDFGASVLKVEKMDGGEIRRAPPFFQDSPSLNSGGMHIFLDTGKKSIVVDYSSPSGIEIINRIVQNVDLVLIEESPNLAMKIIESIKLANQKTSTLAISPHGLNGPYANRLESDLSIFAQSTRLFRQRPSLTDNSLAPVGYAPYTTAMQVGLTAGAIASAILWKNQNNPNVYHAEVSAVEALASNVDTPFVAWALTDGVLNYAPASGRAAYPTGVYECSDGHVQFTGADSPFFERCCIAMGRPEWAEDERFLDLNQKPSHREEFLAHIIPWLKKRTKLEIFKIMQEAKVLCTPVFTVEEAINDPQAIARKSFTTFEQDGIGEIIAPAYPFKEYMSDEEWVLHPAPKFGEHSSEVLSDLGYSLSDQQALFKIGTIR